MRRKAADLRITPPTEICEGRYPYLSDADLPGLIAALKRLPERGALVIVHGHHSLCGEREVSALVDYLDEARACTAKHVAQEHGPAQAIADPAHPRYVDQGLARGREDEVRVMVAQLTASDA